MARFERRWASSSRRRSASSQARARASSLAGTRSGVDSAWARDEASRRSREPNRTGRHVLGFINTGAGAHGLYPSRNAKQLYITNRSEGTISVLDFATRRLVAKWDVGGSPDMGGVSADGKVLWLSGRYNAEVYAISTKDGRVLARIPVGNGPHGVCVWPQPGRYSLGHTGILR